MTLRLALTILFAISLGACSILKPRGDFDSSATLISAQNFNVSGKVGVRYNREDQPRSDTAFYQWQQSGDQFNLNISGALGIGSTQITGTKGLATLTNKDTQIQAESASELLLKATGWQAPLESMTYWVSGVNEPNTNAQASQFDEQGRMTQTQSDGWRATLDYKDAERLPSRIKAEQINSINRVILSINTRSE